ncbi:MAG: hypothetical protein MRY83_23430 [Flavobacteriales bacterium]|nr:hypothetical protein [Flavobacteriales bacterium]
MILAVFIFTDLELQKKLTSLLFIITGIMGLFFLKDARKDFKNKLAALVGGDPIEAQVIRRSKHGIIFESRPLDMLTLKFVDKNGIKRHCNVKARNKFIQNYNEGDSLLGFYNTETNSTYFPGPFGYAVKLI